MSKHLLLRERLFRPQLASILPPLRHLSRVVIAPYQLLFRQNHLHRTGSRQMRMLPDLPHDRNHPSTPLLHAMIGQTSLVPAQTLWYKASLRHCTPLIRSRAPASLSKRPSSITSRPSGSTQGLPHTTLQSKRSGSLAPLLISVSLPPHPRLPHLNIDSSTGTLSSSSSMA